MIGDELIITKKIALAYFKFKENGILSNFPILNCANLLNNSLLFSSLIQALFQLTILFQHEFVL